MVLSERERQAQCDAGGGEAKPTSTVMGLLSDIHEKVKCISMFESC
jgi:hypothetical protein